MAVIVLVVLNKKSPKSGKFLHIRFQFVDCGLLYSRHLRLAYSRGLRYLHLGFAEVVTHKQNLFFFFRYSLNRAP